MVCASSTQFNAKWVGFHYATCGLAFVVWFTEIGGNESWMHNFQIAIAPQGGSKICASHLFQLCA